MKSSNLKRLLLMAVVAWSNPCAWGMDLRFDVATDNNNGNDTDWFGASQLVNLNFPSVNGHNIEQGNASHQSALTGKGNTLGVYYDTFHSLYSSTETPAAAVSTIKSWIKSQFGNYETGSWLVLNEVDSSTWDGSSGDAYRTWLVSTMSALNSAGYTHIILYAENSLASKTYASTWQSIAKYANIGDECYIDGQVAVADNFSVSAFQATYQASYNAWTSASSGAGIPAANLFLGEHFSVNQYAASTYWGADGISGTQWEQTIEARDIAIHNIPFGGFIGYAWDKDAQATGNPTVDLANQIAYERAYASTMVVQTEVPAWTGNDGTTSWNDYLNWTGGLPSTTSAPFPLLASTNPNLSKQTSANFLTAIQSNTTITLDGNQSITNLSFGSPYSYTIAPGTGGTLTLSGSGASIGVMSGSHSITAGLILAGNTAVNLTGNLSLSGGMTNNGYTLTKTGTGTLTISGAQSSASNSALAVQAGTVNVNSDLNSAYLAVSASGGITNFNSAQHVGSVSLTGGYTALNTQGQFLLTHALSVSGTSQLDLTQNDLIDDYTGASPLPAIQANIDSGYKNGTWTGNGIITSSAASRAYTSLGMAEASQVLGLTGSQTGTFDGQTVDSTTVLVKYTWVGDANLDGVVNAEDLAMMVLGGTTWAQGDFNHDGVVNAADYTLYYEALAASGGANISSEVPEPSFGWMLVTMLLGCRRRRGGR